MPLPIQYEDRELLLRIAEGNTSAFEKLFAAYYALLKPFVWKFATTEADREEIIQETFVRVWLHREQLPAIDNLRAWIFTIAANTAYAQLRRQSREHRKINHFLNDHAGGKEYNTPQEFFHLNEVRQLVLDAVQTLPPQQQRIFRMSRDEQKKPSQIAKELGVSVQTVSNTLTTVLKKLRNYLASAGYDLSLLFLVLAGLV